MPDATVSGVSEFEAAMMPHQLWSDLRYAVRSLGRSPGFSAAVVVTIALGVGVNTGIFTLFNGVLFRDLPAPDGHELVSIYQAVEGAPDRQNGFGLFSTAEYRTYRDRARTLSGIIGYSDPTRTTVGGETPREVVGALITCNYFDVLQQPPMLGRALAEADCAPGADPVVVLSHELWTETFAADPAIVGRSVELNRQLLTVVGVAEEGTYTGFGVYRTAYFAPISAQPLLLPNEDGYENDRTAWLFLIGRRNGHVGLDQVRAELDVIAAQIDRLEPARATTLRVDRATPLSIPFLRDAALAIGAIVMTAFGLVLLIACANVSSLFLARAVTRSREFAMRLSLGASRGRVIRQLLTESLLISCVGGALGSVLALWSVQTLIGFALPSLSGLGIPPLLLDSSPDLRVLSLMLALMFGTGLVFGLAPALRVSKPDLHSVIKQGGPGGGSRHGSRLHALLLGVQVALCMMLMIGTGLLLRASYATQTADPGFVYGDVAYASYDLRAAGYDSEGAAVFQRQLLERVAALPGVEAAAQALSTPLTYAGFRTTRVRLPGQDETQARQAQLNVVSPSYFSVVGIPIVRGRTFADADLANEARVAIVTETTARNYWPGENPIGRTLLRSIGQGEEAAFEVVGVAKDAEVTRVGNVDPYYVYFPATARASAGLAVLVRSRTDFAATASGIRSTVAGLDPGVIVSVNPLEANLDFWRGLSGFLTALAASAGVLALGLATVGIYGVVSYFVNRRRREIGIRLALGARPANLLGLILRQTMRPVVIGAVIGIGLAVAVSDVLSSALFGVSSADPLGLGGAAAFVLCVALAAGVLAGRPATRVDPLATLRDE